MRVCARVPQRLRMLLLLGGAVAAVGGGPVANERAALREAEARSVGFSSDASVPLLPVLFVLIFALHLISMLVCFWKIQRLTAKITLLTARVENKEGVGVFNRLLLMVWKLLYTGTFFYHKYSRQIQMHWESNCDDERRQTRVGAPAVREKVAPFQVSGPNLIVVLTLFLECLYHQSFAFAVTTAQHPILEGFAWMVVRITLFTDNIVKGSAVIELWIVGMVIILLWFVFARTLISLYGRQRSHAKNKDGSAWMQFVKNARITKYLLTFLGSTVFITLLRLLIVPADCVEVDGTLVMESFPSIECWTGTHSLMVGGSLLVLIMYVSYALWLMPFWQLLYVRAGNGGVQAQRKSEPGTTPLGGAAAGGAVGAVSAVGEESDDSDWSDYSDDEEAHVGDRGLQVWFTSTSMFTIAFVRTILAVGLMLLTDFEVVALTVLFLCNIALCYHNVKYDTISRRAFKNLRTGGFVLALLSNIVSFISLIIDDSTDPVPAIIYLTGLSVVIVYSLIKGRHNITKTMVWLFMHSDQGIDTYLGEAKPNEQQAVLERRRSRRRSQRRSRDSMSMQATAAAPEVRQRHAPTHTQQQQQQQHVQMADMRGRGPPRSAHSAGYATMREPRGGPGAHHSAPDHRRGYATERQAGRTAGQRGRLDGVFGQQQQQQQQWGGHAYDAADPYAEEWARYEEEQRQLRAQQQRSAGSSAWGDEGYYYGEGGGAYYGDDAQQWDAQYDQQWGGDAQQGQQSSQQWGSYAQQDTWEQQQGAQQQEWGGGSGSGSGSGYYADGGAQQQQPQQPQQQQPRAPADAAEAMFEEQVNAQSAVEARRNELSKMGVESHRVKSAVPNEPPAPAPAAAAPTPPASHAPLTARELRAKQRVENRGDDASSVVSSSLYGNGDWETASMASMSSLMSSNVGGRAPSSVAVSSIHPAHARHLALRGDAGHARPTSQRMSISSLAALDVNSDELSRRLVESALDSRLADPLLTKTPYSRSWAVVVAVETYQGSSGLPRVPHAHNDAHLFAKYLWATGFHVYCLLDEEATLSNLWRVFYDLSRWMGRKDRLCVFFSGHAQHPKDTPESLVLCFHDYSGPNGPQMTIEEFYQLTCQSSTSVPIHTLFLLDIAHHGISSMFVGETMDASKGVPRLAGDATKQVQQHLRTSSVCALSASLNEDRAVDLRSVAFADQDGNGVFTTEMLAGLRDDVFQEKGESWVTAPDVLMYLRRKMGSDDTRVQNPHLDYLIGHQTDTKAIDLSPALDYLEPYAGGDWLFFHENSQHTVEMVRKRDHREENHEKLVSDYHISYVFG